MLLRRGEKKPSCSRKAMSSRAVPVIQLLAAYKEAKPSGSWSTSLTQGFN